MHSINYFINDKAGEGEAEDGCNVNEGAVHLFFLGIKFSTGLVGSVVVGGMNVGSAAVFQHLFAVNTTDGFARALLIALHSFAQHGT